jgi:hypothetical protein
MRNDFLFAQKDHTREQESKGKTKQKNPKAFSAFVSSFLCMLKEYVFSFLLSSRLFIRPFELLGKLLANSPEPEPLDGLVDLLTYWTRVFPYDFRDERIMNHVKHIVAR